MLHEGLLLRRAEELPKGWTAGADIQLYLRALPRVRPALRLSRHTLAALLRDALETEFKQVKRSWTVRCEGEDEGHVPVPTPFGLLLLRAQLARLEGEPLGPVPPYSRVLACACALF